MKLVMAQCCRTCQTRGCVTVTVSFVLAVSVSVNHGLQLTLTACFGTRAYCDRMFPNHAMTLANCHDHPKLHPIADSIAIALAFDLCNTTFYFCDNYLCHAHGDKIKRFMIYQLVHNLMEVYIKITFIN